MNKIMTHIFIVSISILIFAFSVDAFSARFNISENLFEILIFDGINYDPLMPFTWKKKNPSDGNSKILTFYSSKKVYAELVNTLSSKNSNHSILSLSDGDQENNDNWTAIAPKIAKHFKNKESTGILKLPIQADYDFDLKSELPKIHLDNTRDEDFQKLLDLGLAPFDVIFMQRGLCNCTYDDETTFDFSASTTCGGLKSFNIEDSVIFFKRVMSVLNQENEKSFVIMFNDSGFKTIDMGMKEVTFWKSVGEIVVNDSSWNKKYNFYVITKPSSNMMYKKFIGVYISRE